MGNGMGAGNASINSDQSKTLSTEIGIREGTYVSSGQTLFKVINTAQVWAEFDLYQKDAASIKVNEPIKISFDDTNNEIIAAKVNFIQPFFKAG